MYLTNCRLLPELSGGVAAEHGCVEIKDGLIASVLPAAPEGAADVYDCGGMTLLPGTIISTGTPSGVGMGFDPPKFLKPGDVVECAIEGIGTLRNTVR